MSRNSSARRRSREDPCSFWVATLQQLAQDQGLTSPGSSSGRSSKKQVSPTCFPLHQLLHPLLESRHLCSLPVEARPGGVRAVSIRNSRMSEGTSGLVQAAYAEDLSAGHAEARQRALARRVADHHGRLEGDGHHGSGREAQARKGNEQERHASRPILSSSWNPLQN